MSATASLTRASSDAVEGLDREPCRARSGSAMTAAFPIDVRSHEGRRCRDGPSAEEVSSRLSRGDEK